MMEESGRKKRCRKPVSRLSSEISHSGQRKKKAVSTMASDTEAEEVAIAATLDFQLGEEVYLKGRIADNEGFKGEILGINNIDDRGVFTLAMVCTATA